MRSSYIQALSQLDTMALTVLAEAGGESVSGQRAVAYVILNRKNSPGWWSREKNDGIEDDTIKAVCLDPWQFSCWNVNDPTYRRLTSEKTLYTEQFKKIREICKQVLSEYPKNDLTNGATYYCTHAVRYKTKWAKGRRPVASIGNHVFFKF